MQGGCAEAQGAVWKGRGATRRQQYEDEAKAEITSGADGGLVAHGIASSRAVTTNEQPRPESRSPVKLPDICDAFGVRLEDTSAIFHQLQVSYELTSSS